MYRIGIDLGGTDIKAGIVNEQNEIVLFRSIPTMVQRPARSVVKDIADLAGDMLKEASISFEDVHGVGIGSPGYIDVANGIVVYSNNFSWTDIPLIRLLEEYISLPAFMANDAQCAALAETVVGAGKGCNNVVMVTLGTGVGCGVIINGRMLEGKRYAGVPVGHIVIEHGGEKCTCGKRGCLEAYASATALIRNTKIAAVRNPQSCIWDICKGNINAITGKTAFKAAKMGDTIAKDVVHSYIKYLAIGISNIVNIFMPQSLLLGGGISNEGEALISPLSELVKAGCYAADKIELPNIRKAELGNQAGIIGSALIVSEAAER